MKPTLWIFTPKDGCWHKVRECPTYRDAILLGQDLAPGSFNIDTGDRVPSREEQLGEVVEDKVRKPSLKSILDIL